MRFSEHAAKKGKIGNVLNVRRSKLMMSNPHAPCKYGIIRLTVKLSQFVNLCFADTSTFFYVVPRCAIDIIFKRGKMIRIIFNEIFIFSP